MVEYARAGTQALHLEDQKFPKRCGHLDGKELVPTDHMIEKVQWAAKAATEADGGRFIICARTDAGVDGFDAASPCGGACPRGSGHDLPQGARERG